MKKFLISLVPALVAAAFALVPSTAASAVCTTNVLCDGSNNPLRDNGAAPPTGGKYGSSALVVNTAGTLRFTAKVAKLPVRNQSPAGYVFFGVKHVRNPVLPVGKVQEEKCEEKLGKPAEAEGLVTFVDVQKATLSANGKSSPVYDNTSTPWPVKVRSDHCEKEPGVVKVEGVGLYFPELGGEVATGTFTGKYVQPALAGKCPGGGVELDVKQPLVVLAVAEAKTAELDNGTVGKNAFVCFVSSNNYLFPKTAPVWEPFEDSAGSAVPGTWKD
jgi:hypothetical protein